MKTYKLILLLILFQQCSVKPDSPCFNEVFIHRNEIASRELRTIDTSYLFTSNDNNSSRYFYRTNNSQDSTTLYYFFEEFHYQDSIVVLFNDSCRKVDAKDYKIGNKDYLIEIYYYDREDSVDEETTVYFNNEYGILIMFNDGWLILDGLFVYDEISKELIKLIIEDSSNNFPSWRQEYLEFSKKLQVPTANHSP